MFLTVTCFLIICVNNIQDNMEAYEPGVNYASCARVNGSTNGVLALVLAAS